MGGTLALCYSYSFDRGTEGVPSTLFCLVLTSPWNRQFWESSMEPRDSSTTKRETIMMMTVVVVEEEPGMAHVAAGSTLGH